VHPRDVAAEQPDLGDVVHAGVEVHGAAALRPRRADEPALAGHQPAGVAQVVAVEEGLAHQEGAVRMSGRRCEEGRGLLRVDAGRLLAEHVLADRERVARHLVHVRDRHRDQHGVHVVAGQQRSPVGGGPG
jgi:hypothetical protein